MYSAWAAILRHSFPASGTMTEIPLLTYAYACIEVMYTLTLGFRSSCLDAVRRQGTMHGRRLRRGAGHRFCHRRGERASWSARDRLQHLSGNGRGDVSHQARGAAREHNKFSRPAAFIPARELFDLDIVDVVAPEGRALETAHEWMLDPDGANWRRRQALVNFRKQCFPVRKKNCFGWSSFGRIAPWPFHGTTCAIWNGLFRRSRVFPATSFPPARARL